MSERNPAQPAPGRVSLSLDLPGRHFVRYESIPFSVTLRNNAAAALRDLLAPQPENAAVKVSATGPFGSQQADQLSGRRRDGQRVHPSMNPPRIEVAPGQAVECKGDLLEWFGKMPPGQYTAKPEYSGVLMLNSPQPAAATVDLAHPVSVTAPRPGARMPNVSLPCAWVHGEEDRQALFYQLQSDALPSNPRLCLRVAEGPAITGVEVSTITLRQCRSGHAFWTDAAGKRLYTTVEFDAQAQPSAPRPLALPPGSQVLRSPQSTPDGSAWVPFSDREQRRVGVLRIPAAGAPAAFGPLDAGSMGPYCCYWDYDARLLFAWAGKGTGNFHYSTLSLQKPENGFAARFDYEFDSPVLWIDGYSDLETDADAAEPVYWIVHERGAALVCSRFWTVGKRWSAATMVRTGQEGAVRVFSSVVTADHQLAFLFATQDGQIFYGSTARSEASPLNDILRRRVRLEDNPALLAASSAGVFPWVHVRYAAPERSMIAVAKIEPHNERDEMDDVRE